MAKSTLSNLFKKQKATPAERRERRKEHPWRKNPSVVSKAEDEQLADLREIERGHEAVTGSRKRGGAPEAGKLRKRRFSASV